MTDLERAVALFRENNYTVTAVKGEREFTSHKTGISPLSDLLKDDPGALIGASVADRVVGGAAAFLAAYGQAKAVHAGLMSARGAEVLERYNISYDCDRKTDIILARDGVSVCPFERLCLSIDDPAEAFAAITARIAVLRAQKAQRAEEARSEEGK
ncbi:MAG: DUF1893 domain-containing protein [Clostridiales bacterium]|jgi:hypothetical protein|nr:DUF1893 domain-containing protein [Clostridiales bacterium]